MSEDEIRDRVTRIEVQIESLVDSHKRTEQSIDKINGKIGWGVMSVLAAVIVAVLRGAGVIQ